MKYDDVLGTMKKVHYASRTHSRENIGYWMVLFDFLNHQI